MISNIDRLVQLQIQLHEWKEEDLNNYKRKIAEQQKEIPEGSSSEEILAIEENKREKSPDRGKNYTLTHLPVYGKIAIFNRVKEKPKKIKNSMFFVLTS